MRPVTNSALTRAIGQVVDVRNIFFGGDLHFPKLKNILKVCCNSCACTKMQATAFFNHKCPILIGLFLLFQLPGGIPDFLQKGFITLPAGQEILIRFTSRPGRRCQATVRRSRPWRRPRRWQSGSFELRLRRSRSALTPNLKRQERLCFKNVLFPFL